MVTRIAISPGRISGILLSLMVVLSSAVVVSSLSQAQPATKQDAMKQKGQWELDIAAEQINRGMFKDAEARLLQTQELYKDYLPAEDNARLVSLLDRARKAVAERDQILSALKASDELEKSGQYGDAIARLDAIKDSPFLKKPEQQQIKQTIAGLKEKASAANRQYQSLFDKSEKLYLLGEFDKAEKGFAEIANSGADLRSKDGRTARDYLERIAQARTGQAVTVVQPVQQAATPDKSTPPTVSSMDMDKELIDSGKPAYKPSEAKTPKKSAIDVASAVQSISTNPMSAVESQDRSASTKLVEKPIQPNAIPLEPAGQSIAEVPVATSVTISEAAPAPTLVEQPSIQTQISPVTSIETVPVSVAQPASEPSAQDGYIREILRQRNVQRDYTGAIVNDALDKASKYLEKEQFVEAKQSLARAFAAIDRNKMLLGDELYKNYQMKLSELESLVDQRRADVEKQRNQTRIIETQKLTDKIRTQMEEQRQQAVVDYMARAKAFQKEQRYEEALGQLEQLLTIDPTHSEALLQKQLLQDAVNWREQLRINKESAKEEMALLLEANRKAIPFFEEITYPKNWKEIVAKREAMELTPEDQKNAAAYDMLKKVVDLTQLREDMPLSEAINVLRNSIEPPLPITVNWNDLREVAFIEQTTPIGIAGDGLFAVALKTGLEEVLRGVGSSTGQDVDYYINQGVVVICTTQNPLYLKYKFILRYYDVSELLSPPSSGYSQMGGMMGGSMGGMQGGMMGGGMGGMGGMMGGGMGGMGGMMGGGMGGMGGMMGGGMGGMGGGMGGMMGGMMGGGMGYNQMLSQYRGYELIYLIQETCGEYESWYDNGGEGRIQQFGGTYLVVKQTRDVQEQIIDLLNSLKQNLKMQVAIEARFLLVGENYLEDIGMDTNINSLNLGKYWQTNTGFQQDSYGFTAAQKTGIAGSLGGMNPVGTMGLSYVGALDDLQVDFMIRATQAHSNAKTLTAPKTTVMNSETGTITVQKEIYYVSDTTYQSDNVTTTGVDRTVYWWDNENDSIVRGITLMVTPTISADRKYVLLNIDATLTDVDLTQTATVTAADPSGLLVTNSYTLPQQENTSVTTRVAVPDRGTVLLGGLTLSSTKEVEAGVPILNKIPLINRFFSNRSKVEDKQILLILVKPTIIIRDEAEEEAVAAMTR